jgi:hypothetical protein
MVEHYAGLWYSMEYMKLRINNSFKDLLPKLSIEEYTNLENDCIRNGIREPLLLWDTIIIDGHNRYSIARKNNLK